MDKDPKAPQSALPGDKSDEALREEGRQRAMDFLLKALADQEAGAQPAPTSGKPDRSHARVPLLVAAAACLVIGIGLWLGFRSTQGPGPDGPNPGPLAFERVTLAHGWVGEARGATYHIVKPGLVRVDRGELFVQSVPVPAGSEPRGTLRVETPAGLATATGTEFYVGYHPEPERNQTMKPVLSRMRVLVLSGIVTLANALGSVTGEANDLLAAETDAKPVKTTIKANTHFAIDLYRALALENEGKNLFLSPYSISSALTMVAEGARGKTARQMGNMLRFPSAAQPIGAGAQSLPWKAGLIQSGFQQLKRTMDGGGSEFDLNIANALCLTNGDVKEEYRATLQNTYDAEVFPGDLAAIDAWVKKKTAGKITNLLAELDPETLCVLLNAIYFKAEWREPFDPKETKDLSFVLPDQKTVSVPVMCNRSKYKYMKLPAIQTEFLSIPYKGGYLSLIVLLPRKGGLPALEKALSPESLAMWIGSLNRQPKQKVYVQLPRFNAQSEYTLGQTAGTRPKGVLPTLGMADAFISGKADFSGISDAGIWVDQIKHRACCEITETGTEATAVTAKLPKMEEESKDFRARRPFLYLIHHNPTGSLLFMGRMLNPAK